MWKKKQKKFLNVVFLPQPPTPTPSPPQKEFDIKII